MFLILACDLCITTCTPGTTQDDVDNRCEAYYRLLICGVSSGAARLHVNHAHGEKALIQGLGAVRTHPLCWLISTIHCMALEQYAP